MNKPEAHKGYASLRAEYRADSLGIGQPRPRLSWTVTTGKPGWEQRAYQLVKQGANGTLVETPRVESSQSTFVDWPFDALDSRARVEVRVRVWDADGNLTETTQPLVIEAGLFGPHDWDARFITPDWEEDTSVDQPVTHFRREFAVRPGLLRARLYSSALGVYDAAINATPVSDAVLAPGWTSYKHRLRYQVSDVTAALVAGTNVLSSRVGDGWFRGRIGFLGGRRNIYGDRLAFLAQLELQYADGTVEVVRTGTSQGWACSTGGIRSSSIYDGEVVDARLEPAGWMSAGHATAAWTDVREVGWDLGTLIAADGPAVRRTGVVPPAAISRSPSGKLLVDFGQNLVGWVRIRVRGQRGRTITFRHAEVLEDGELCTRPLRICKATDQYVLGGGGEVETWEPRFTFHGFRYVEVDGWPGELKAADIEAVVVHSDMTRTGWFECSNPDVNRLHDNVVWSMRGNFLDVPTDCPQRDERLGWTGDLQVFAPTACFLFDSAGFLSSWLKDLAAEQAEDGLVPIVVPNVIPVRPSQAGWGDATTVVPWTLYQRTGDLGVLRRQFESMKGWVEQVLDRANPEGLWDQGKQLGDWLDPGATTHYGGGRTNPHVVATANLARSLRIVADTAQLLGFDADHAHYRTAWLQARAAFRRRFVTADGWIISDSPTAYAMALQFDLLEEGERRGAGTRLKELVAREGHHIGTGFLGTPLICDALVNAGHADAAYRLLLQTEAPSWLFAVRMGATTIWERWDSMLADGKVNPQEMTSFNHYAFGAIADWLHRSVAGLDTGAPGYRRLRIQPRPGGGLTWARARHLTSHGEASVGWLIDAGVLKVEATVPPNTVAEVNLPGTEPLIVGSGSHAWALPWRAPQPPGWTVDAELAALRADVSVWIRLGMALGEVDAQMPLLLDSPALAVLQVKTLREVLTLSRHYKALVIAADGVFAAASAPLDSNPAQGNS